MELALIVLPLIAKYGPSFVQEIIALCHQSTAGTAPTMDDWNKAFDLAKNPIADVKDMPAGSPA